MLIKVAELPFERVKSSPIRQVKNNKLCTGGALPVNELKCILCIQQERQCSRLHH